MITAKQVEEQAPKRAAPAASRFRGLMQLEFINPLIQATVDTFNMLAGVRPERTNVAVKRGDVETYGLSGIISLVGPADGTVVLNMSEEVALGLVSKLTGEDVRRITADVIDAIGEFANVVAGDAKTRLFDKGYRFDISLPRVLLGRNLVSIGSPLTPWIVISFASPAGSFDVEISMTEPHPDYSDSA